MRVALAQIDCVLGDTDKNLRKAKEVVAEARERGANLTVFLELSLSGYALGELSDDVAIGPALLARELDRLAEEGGDL